MTTTALPDALPAIRSALGAAVEIDPAGTNRMTGDASTRTYYRFALRHAAVPSVVVMHLPADFLKSDEATSDERPKELPFLAVQRFLAERDVPVPRVVASDLPARVVVLEDLGDETFFERLRPLDDAGRERLYEQAVDLLVHMHARCAAMVPGVVAFERRFDRKLLRRELDHYREWGLEALHGPLATDARSALDAAFDALADELARVPLQLTHRDYQSRNLMVRPDGSLVVIDFQDALLAPVPYDLVALLCDSYVELDAGLQQRMIARYGAARRLEKRPFPRDFERLFWLQAVQRKLKDAGRFVFIDRVRENPSFLQWFPRSLRYVARAIERLGGCHDLERMLPSLVPDWADPRVPGTTIPSA